MKQKLILFMILAAFLLTGCLEGKAPDESSVAEANKEANKYIDPLDGFAISPESNGGKTITILTNTYHEYEFLAPETTGGLINDAVYKRNMAVEELLGIELEVVTLPGLYGEHQEFWKTVSSSILANDGAYDIVSAMVSCMQCFATPEYYLDLNTLDNLKLTNPWWVTGMQEDLSLGGKLLCIIGDMNLSMYKQFPVIFANKTKLESYGVSSDSLFTDVQEGAWTFDTLFSIARNIEKDMNGDSQIQVNIDEYGLGIQNTPFWAVQAAFDLPNIDLDESGVPYVVGLTEAFANAAEHLASVIHSTSSIIVPSPSAPTVDMTVDFVEQQSAFLLTTMNEVERMRNMSNDFTILPFPKLNADQENYRTLIATATNMNYVPVTVDDPELIAKVLESLAYFSYKDVVPAYYETALKERYSRDENTKIMLDIIRESAVLPFEYAYSTILGSPHHFMAHVIMNNSAGEIASSLQSAGSTWNALIDQLMETFSVVPD